MSVVDLLVRLAPLIGARIELEPQAREAGCIVFASGYRSYFWMNRFELNATPLARICQDKGLAAHFLVERGFRVAEWLVVSPSSRKHFGDDSHGLEAARAFADRIGRPVFVKPLSMSQGRLVRLVQTDSELDYAVNEIWREMALRRGRRLALVQARCTGPEYRIVVLEGAVLAAYERSPLQVLGDGRSSVADLLDARAQQFVRDGRDLLELPIEDPRIDETLKRAGLNRRSVLPVGKRLSLFDLANLSLGGTAENCLERMHPALRELACRVASALHLTFCGIDMFISEIDTAASSYEIIEVNSAPGLDDSVFAGTAQGDRVDDLYLRLLAALERRSGLLGFEGVAGERS